MHRSKRKRNIIIFSLVGVLLCMVVGYAAFQTRLEIKGTSKVTSNWDIRITNVTDGTSTGQAENAIKPSYTALTATMEANLYDKGDAMEYDVTIENKGTLDAKLNDILTNLENSNNEAVLITFSGYTKGEILKSGESKLVHVKIEYNPEYEGGETSSEVEIVFDYIQDDKSEDTPTTYLLTYDYKTNGGERVDSEGEYLASGSNVDLTNIAYKTGYRFVGWNTDKDAKVGMTSYQMKEGPATLYAIYSKDLKVTYEKGNNIQSIGKIEDQCTIYNNETSCEVTLPSITPNNGYSVDGWYNGNNKIGNSNDKYKVTANITLTSKVKQNIYTVTYDYKTNGGTSSTKTTDKVGYGENVDLAPTATKEGWTFVGWNTNKDATTKLSSLTMGNSNVTLYAIYRKEAKQVTITFNKNGATSQTPNGGSANSNTTITQSCTIPAVYNNDTQASSCNITSPTINASSTTPTVVGYNTSAQATSSSWNQNTSKAVSSDATYYAITRSATQLTASFNANGATIGATNASCYRYNGEASCNVTTPSITRSGFTITGWGTSSSATTAEINANSLLNLTENKTYYAVTSKVVTVTYNKDSTVSAIGRSEDTCTIQNSATNCGVTLPSITVDDTHILDGWYKGSTKIGNPNAKYNVSDNITLTAKGKADTTAPTITFTPNNYATYVADGLDVEVTVKDEKPLRFSNVSYGWSTSATTAPSEYTSIDVDSGTNETSFIIPGESNSNISGIYYLWLNGTISDAAGNNSKTPAISGAFYFDNEKPTVSITSTKTGNDVSVKAIANDGYSGINKYYFSKDGGQNYIETTNDNYTFIDLEPGNYIITVYVTDKAGNQSELATKTEGIGAEDFCKGNGIDDFGDCLIATEAKESNINTAKSIIKGKGTTDITKASPSVVYKEVHSASTTTVTSSRSEIYVGTGYTFDSSKGMYTLSNWQLRDTESIDFKSSNYYVTANFDINSTISGWTSSGTIYKIVNMKTTTAASGQKTYTYTVYKYNIAPISYNTADVGMFSDVDDQGDSFYYRGSISNNYVKFANKIWRVIRVNGDGSVRMIYDGTSAHSNGEKSDNRQVGTSRFNSYYADNTYAGYMYGNPDDFGATKSRDTFLWEKSDIQPDTTYYYGTSYTLSGRSYKLAGTITSGKYNSSRVGKYTCFSTSKTGTCQRLALIKEYKSETTALSQVLAYGSQNKTAARSNVTDSSIKTYLDDWYVDNFTTAQRNKLSKSAVFCNSRVVYPNLTEPDNYNNYAYGLNPTSYSIGKIRSLSTYGATYSCENIDSFSVNTTYGNGDLTYPIGLISLDEALRSGLTAGVSNTLNYLYTGNGYWTMTPAGIVSSAYMTIIHIGISGALGNYQSSISSVGVKPVINITTSSINYSGNGTQDDPYVLS